VPQSRQGGKNRRIAGAPGNHHVNIGFKRPLEGAHAHLTDDVHRGVHLPFVERRHVVDRRNAVLSHGLLKDAAVDVGAQHGHAEAHAFLFRDFPV
jgi:hypothetical protein